ncbi:MAG: carbohydrate ABC transporter permease [Candidatus Hadarchaeum sp.]|uniref:carbohydrate ABC transporter permease n=1 Tax=Candidatus Hadarchaeum sp. TaxID=2883567 RepID=UPI003D11A7C3
MGGRQISQAWFARRRRAKAAFVYVFLGAMALAVVGPFVYAILSAFKVNPLEWPPSLHIPRLWPPNWIAAWKLGVQAGNNGWLGGWAPGKFLSLEVTFLYPPGVEGEPRVEVLRPPGRGPQQPPDPRPITAVEIEELEEREIPEGCEKTFKIILRHLGAQTYPVLPLAVAGPPNSKFLRATLAPHSVRGLGTTAYWDNLASGVLGYIFSYFIQAWTEFRDRMGNPIFPRWVKNSFVIAMGKVLVALLFAPLAGYALARLRFPGRNLLFFLVMFTMMVPQQVTFISNYVLLRDGLFGISRVFGKESLLNTYWALFLPALVSSLGVIMMKQFFESIPVELEEAARIDGAGTMRIYTKIILPMAKPALAVLAILTFQGSWNEFFWPLVVLRDMEMFTLPIGLLFFRQYYGAAGGANWNLILSGTVISAIPVLIIFILFQRHFVEGFRLSGIK